MTRKEVLTHYKKMSQISFESLVVEFAHTMIACQRTEKEVLEAMDKVPAWKNWKKKRGGHIK